MKIGKESISFSTINIEKTGEGREDCPLGRGLPILYEEKIHPNTVNYLLYFRLMFSILKKKPRGKKRNRLLIHTRNQNHQIVCPHTQHDCTLNRHRCDHVLKTARTVPTSSRLPGGESG